MGSRWSWIRAIDRRFITNVWGEEGRIQKELQEIFMSQGIRGYVRERNGCVLLHDFIPLQQLCLQMGGEGKDRRRYMWIRDEEGFGGIERFLISFNFYLLCYSF